MLSLQKRSKVVGKLTYALFRDGQLTGEPCRNGDLKEQLKVMVRLHLTVHINGEFTEAPYSEDELTETPYS